MIHAAPVHGASNIDTGPYTEGLQSTAEQIPKDWMLLDARGDVPYIRGLWLQVSA
jgi:hypothetical protein